MRRVIGIGILLFVLGCSSQLNDKQRRDHLLMPKIDSDPYKAWVIEYGDSAESWELFTLSFHTKYITQLTAQVNALGKRLELYPDPNEIAIMDNPEIIAVLPIDPNGTTTKEN